MNNLNLNLQGLASLALEATGKQFEQRLMILKYIANA